MNENIDVRVSNYLNILSNPSLKNELDSQTVDLLNEAVKIYALTTAKNYVETFRNQRLQNSVNQGIEHSNPEPKVI